MTIATITEQTGGTYTGILDTRLRQFAPTTNYNTSTTLEVKNTASDSDTALFIFTGLANITGPVTVNSATFEIYCSTSSNSVNDFSLYRCIVDTDITQATWTDRLTATAWTSGGAQGSGTDIDGTALASTTNVVAAAFTSFTSAGLAQYCEDVINGVITNQGVICIRDGAVDSTFNEFRTSNSGTNSSRPILTIDYTAGGGGSSSIPPVRSQASRIAPLMFY